MPEQTGDIEKGRLLAELGFGGDVSRYDGVLEEAGLSRPAKPRISLAKRARVQEVLEAAFFRVCGRGDCNAAAAAMAGGRSVAPASDAKSCEVCGGSPSRGAVDRMVDACRRVGWRRLVVLGGSPGSRAEMEKLVGGRLELRLVDGMRSATAKEAGANTAWADRVVRWGGTELAHKVSNLYTGEKVVTAPGRSVAEVCEAVVQSAEGGRGKLGGGGKGERKGR